MDSINLSQTFINKPVSQHIKFCSGRSASSSLKVDKLEKFLINPNEKPTRMLLELLKSSISGEKPDLAVFKGAANSDWEKFLSIANEASVTAIALDSYKELPSGTIPSNILVNMMEVQKEVEQKHANQERVLGELTARFADKGIETIQLKGLGLSMGYPIPQHRFGGDIDIFTRKKGTVTQIRSNSSDIIDDMMVGEGRHVNDYKIPKYKHSEFRYNDIMIENHRYFVNKERLIEAGDIDAYLHSHLNPRTQILPNGTKILVPSKEFNTVFLAQHAFQHYIFGGIDIHHLTDWGVHIKENGLNFPKELKGTKLEAFTYALTNLSNKYLGTKVNAPKDPEYETKVFETLLNPVTDVMPKGLNDVEVVLFKTKRFLKRAKRAEEYGGPSVFKSFVSSAMLKLKNPSGIFVRI